MAKQFSARVVLGQSKIEVGDLKFTKDGSRQFSAFSYSESWIFNARAFQLSPELILANGQYYASGTKDVRDALHGPFADVAPDTWGRRLLERSYGSGLSEFDLLVLADDASRQGALRFLDEEGEIYSGKQAAVPRLLELEEITRLSQAYEQGIELSDEEIKALAGAGGTLGGARPKANVLDGEDLWMAKFTSIHDTHQIERMEVATLKLAAICGIRVPEVRLELAASAHPIALLKRFDRRGAERIPYISARTALQKTGSELGSYTEIAEFIRTWSIDAKADLQELYLRIIFTILVSNKDDHLKNHGFIYAGNNQWSLSPIFDVNPAPDRNPHLETAIMEGSGYERSIKLALEAHLFFDIKKDDAADLIRATAKKIAVNWRACMKDQGLVGTAAKEFEPAFEHTEADLARAM